MLIGSALNENNMVVIHYLFSYAKEEPFAKVMKDIGKKWPRMIISQIQRFMRKKPQWIE